MKVWFVSSGEYSAYQVERVFASRELAEQYAAADPDPERYGHRFVEPDDTDGYEIVDELPPPVRHLELFQQIGQDRQRRTTEHDLYPGLDEIPDPCRVSEYVNDGRYTDPGVYLRVSGTDIERVRKVFTERRAQIIAEYPILIAKAKAADEARRQQRPRSGLHSTTGHTKLTVSGHTDRPDS